VEAIEAAADLVRQRFPEALAAFLGGSVLTRARTPMSDLDIVVIRPDGAAVYRETVRHDGWLAELFVNTPTVYHEILDREIAARRSPLLHMVGAGVILVDAGGSAARLHAEAARALAEGPPAASAEEIEDARYTLSDLDDDLAGATGVDEIAAIATRVYAETGRLALMLARSWLGGGKWLARRLRTTDPDLHAALTEALRSAVADADVTGLRRVAQDVLDRAGGRLMEGYRRDYPSVVGGAANCCVLSRR
jgi:hypothetical protein